MGTEAKNYWADPNLLEEVTKNLTNGLESKKTFAQVCEQSSVLISKSVQFLGIENIPKNEPLVIIKNHPCHFDFVLLHKIFDIRPDIRIPIKSSSLINSIPTENFIILRKTGSHANREDVLTMQDYLKSGGSVITTPWGALDHMAKDLTTKERSFENIMKFTTFNHGSILTLNINAEWNNTRNLPLKNAVVDIGTLINSELYSANSSIIRTIVSEMYQKHCAD